jgi:glutathione synthase/RimK-type ligase-like ATP-grasp enzyme
VAGRRGDEVIALATSQEWSALSPDDAPLVPELKKIGLDARPVVWSDASVDWRTFDLVVIRSCWDYHLRVDEFSAWIDRLVRDGVPVFNPPAVLRWNMHKSYLLDLAEKGVRIPRTRFERDVIVKPAVSASAHQTHLLRGDVIVQEFVHEIVDDGEWSLVFIDRRFSHAVKKSPKSGDFRVQEEHGGSSVPMTASRTMIDEAARVISHVDGDLLYARVDVVDRPAGVTLMELELIEPWLYLTSEPGAMRRFAEAIAVRRRA